MTLTLPGTTPLPKRKPRAARHRAGFDTTLGRAALQALAVIGFFAFWEIGVRMGWISAFLVGSPFGIFADGFKMIASGDLLLMATMNGSTSRATNTEYHSASPNSDPKMVPMTKPRMEIGRASCRERV